jgi:hypothetical protein
LLAATRHCRGSNKRTPVSICYLGCDGALNSVLGLQGQTDIDVGLSGGLA